MASRATRRFINGAAATAVSPPPSPPSRPPSPILASLPLPLLEPATQVTTVNGATVAHGNSSAVPRLTGYTGPRRVRARPGGDRSLLVSVGGDDDEEVKQPSVRRRRLRTPGDDDDWIEADNSKVERALSSGIIATPSATAAAVNGSEGATLPPSPNYASTDLDDEPGAVIPFSVLVAPSKAYSKDEPLTVRLEDALAVERQRSARMAAAFGVSLDTIESIACDSIVATPPGPLHLAQKFANRHYAGATQSESSFLLVQTVAIEGAARYFESDRKVKDIFGTSHIFDHAIISLTNSLRDELFPLHLPGTRKE